MLWLVVDFGEVVEGAGLFRIRHHVFAAVVFDGDVAFFDVDVGGAVFAHGAEFDEVTLRRVFADGKQKIERADDVVHPG